MSTTMSDNSTITEPTGADFQRSWESKPRSGEPDPSDPTDTRMVWGYCAPFCIDAGPTDGASVKDHGDRCESKGMSVEAEDAKRGAVTIFTRAVQPYFHGTVHRSLTYRNARASKVDLDILTRSVKGGQLKTFHMTPGEARSLAKHLSWFADVADGCTGDPNAALARRKLTLAG